MNTVDVNYKIWNCKAKTHFYIHSGILAALSMLSLFAFLDYANLPRDSPSEIRRAVFTKFLVFIPFKVAISGSYLLLLLCPNQIWYGICMAFQAVFRCWQLFQLTFNLLGFGITQTNVPEERMVLKHYTCGLVTEIVACYGSFLCGMYFCWILFELSFLYRPKRSSELYVVRVTSPNAEQATDITIDTYGNSLITRAPPSPDPTLEDEEDSNESDPVDQEKLKNDKSGKSQKSKKSQKSRKSQKSKKDKSNKSKKTEKSQESSSKSRSSKSSKSSKSGGVDSLNSEESVKIIAI